jgi:2-C-methyl-D-erythritol 4-phosphate cytidylyltransferase
VSAPPRVAVIIPAAGSGARAGNRKQYADLCGKPILAHALHPFISTPGVEWIVVALPPDQADSPPDWLVALDTRISIAAGGADRGASVRNALMTVPEDADIVIVHDAARPLVSRSIIDRTIAAVEDCGVIAAIPVTDTIKEVDADGRVTSTPDRARLWSAQTPQAFPRALLLGAHLRAAEEGYVSTDDAALVERYGGSIHVVQGAPDNIKVTTPADLTLARALLRCSETAGAR